MKYDQTGKYSSDTGDSHHLFQPFHLNIILVYIMPSEFKIEYIAAEKEEAFEHAHSDLPVSLGRCLFSYEAGIANSCRTLHL